MQPNRAANIARQSATYALLFLCLVCGVSALAATTDDLQALLANQNPEAAYTLGREHEDELGNPDFDFYFGLAAIDSGHAGEGVLALERVVSQSTDNLIARAQLARAYFVLGDDARAESEFQYLKTQNPPSDVADVIDRYLTALQIRKASYQTTWAGFIEAGIGFDDNTNSGAGSSSINVPILGSVTLQAGGIKVPSVYQQIIAGTQVSTPLMPGLVIFAGANVDDKINDASAAHAYDTLSASLNLGTAYTRQNDVFKFAVSVSDLELDGLNYLGESLTSGEWTHQFDEQQSVTATILYARLHYLTEEVRDSDLPSVDLSYRQALRMAWDPTIVVGVTDGEEKNSYLASLARHIYGTRLIVSVVPQSKWTLSSALGYQQSDYEGPDPLLGVTRRDRYSTFDLLATYQWNRRISIRGEALISTNHSNLGIYAYDRNVIEVRVRYDF